MRPPPCRILSLALCAGLVACASGLKFDDRPLHLEVRVPSIEPCEAVADADFGGPRGGLTAVAYVSRPRSGQVRAHFGTDSGLTILDVEVNGGTELVHGQSELGRLPGLVGAVSADLRRLLGDRSVFAAPTPIEVRRVLDDAAGRVAMPLPEGAWVVVLPAELQPGWATLHVTLLDSRRVPEAEMVYEDPGPEGLPRTLRLKDLRDGHTLLLDVQHVVVAAPSDGP